MVNRDEVRTVPDAADPISRGCTALGLSARVRRRARRLLRDARRAGLRRTEVGLTAGCVYLAARLEGEPRTQLQVAEALWVSEVTVATNCKLVAAATGMLAEFKKMCWRRRSGWLVR